ncbi:MAG: dethiobiotin synthase [Candidatus Jidaibacter sp.]|jgi:dethiobiotin synthetase|nr:dethiobiotin synthase [Candidatus Jidaibacter sp.]
MKIFIAGTDTDIGKTLVSTWLCLHTGFDYFKPIQTGSRHGTDSQSVQEMTNSKVHKESYLYKEPLSPHLAAKLENSEIDLSAIKLPNTEKLIVEGAGGLLVPINKHSLMIDLIKQLAIPVILVASSRLGTINHTLLSLEAMRSRGVKTLGVIVNGEKNQDNCDAIEFYGKVSVLAQLPFISKISKQALQQIPMSDNLKKVLV